MRHIAHTCAALLSLLSPWAMADSARVAAPMQELRTRIDEVAKSRALPGFSLAIVTGDGAVLCEARGHADLARKTAYTTRTIQPVASVSKTVIGVCLMMAVERGEANLDTPIETLAGVRLRNPAHPGTPITLRQLATHTSSVRDDTRYEKSYCRGTKPARSLREFLGEYLAAKDGGLPTGKAFLKAAPGAEWSYTNIGAALAALALEERTGRDFRELSRERVFAPLEMNDTHWGQEAGAADRQATLHDKNGKALPVYSLCTYPDGGLNTTCEDLARYLAEIIRGSQGRGTVLTSDSVNQMLKAQFDPGNPPRGLTPKEPNSGLFWLYGRKGGVGHTGSDPGVTAILSLDTKRGVGRILITNIDIDESEEASRAVAMLWKALGEAAETGLPHPAANSGTAQ